MECWFFGERRLRGGEAATIQNTRREEVKQQVLKSGVLIRGSVSIHVDECHSLLCTILKLRVKERRKRLVEPSRVEDYVRRVDLRRAPPWQRRPSACTCGHVSVPLWLRTGLFACDVAPRVCASCVCMNKMGVTSVRKRRATALLTIKGNVKPC